MATLSAKRIIQRSQLVRLRKAWKTNRKRVVFTNGVFDILHVGHVDTLTRAKSFGDILVVGLNSDASVRRLKGKNRPINNQRDRGTVLLALEAVDLVCVFEEDTPLELIQALQPDVLVKGAEYKTSDIVGAEDVLLHGGIIRRVKMRAGYSTTDAIQRAGLRKAMRASGLMP